MRQEAKGTHQEVAQSGTIRSTNSSWVLCHRAPCPLPKARQTTSGSCPRSRLAEDSVTRAPGEQGARVEVPAQGLGGLSDAGRPPGTSERPGSPCWEARLRCLRWAAVVGQRLWVLCSPSVRSRGFRTHQTWLQHLLVSFLCKRTATRP